MFKDLMDLYSEICDMKYLFNKEDVDTCEVIQDNINIGRVDWALSYINEVLNEDRDSFFLDVCSSWKETINYFINKGFFYSKDFHRYVSFDFLLDKEIIVLNTGRNQVLKTNMNLIGNGYLFLPKGIIGIDSYAFKESKGLLLINFPKTLKYFGVFAFAGCHNLNFVVIPDEVYEISNDCFCETGIKEVHLGKNTKSLLTGAFRRCPKLEKVYIKSDEDSIFFAKGTFDNPYAIKLIQEIL